MAKQLSKEELEKKKLKAEIDAIKLQMQVERPKMVYEAESAKREMIKTRLNYPTLVIGIILGILAIVKGSNELLDQTERDFNFRQNMSLIALVNQLNSENSFKRDNAAILLSLFEEDALPILFLNLDLVENTDATIRSIKQIETKIGTDKGTEKVIDPLIASANEVFFSEIKKSVEDMNTTSIKNYIEALGALGKNRREKIEDMFNKWKPGIENIPKDKELIEVAMQVALDKLKE